MQALQFSATGSLDTLQLHGLAKPVPAAGEPLSLEAFRSIDRMREALSAQLTGGRVVFEQVEGGVFHRFSAPFELEVTGLLAALTHPNHLLVVNLLE